MKTFLKVVSACLLFQMAYGQQYLLTIKNDAQPSASTYEFDVYIEAVGSTFELVSVQPIFTFNNTGITNGGSLTYSYVAASTEFSVTAQVPTSATISTNQLRLAAPAPPTLGTGQVIPLSPGLKIGRYRVTNTVAFAAASAGVTWKTVTNPFTKVSVNVGGVATDITNAAWIASSVANAALPVEITNCTAVANRLSTSLNWTTSTETNNFGFNIERKSVTGSNWTKVGFVAGKGTSTTPSHYSYVDEGVAVGTYNYRLQQVDKSGASKYSSVMTVDVGSAARIFTLADNYPNPFNPTTNIEFTLPSDGHVTLKVYNTVGQEVATLFDGQGQAGKYIQAKFDASRLASGIYFARLQYGGKSLMKKMLLVK